MKWKSSVVSPYLWQEGGYIRPAQFVHLVLLLLSVSANDIQKNFIAQDNACAGGSNTITITLQVQNKLFRSYTGYKPAPLASQVQINGLVQTGQLDTSSLPIIDRQRSRSSTAVVAVNLGQNVKETSLRVDNAFRAGFSVNETVQLDQEVVKILGLKGVGCNKSHVVHVGCWNELTVARAQHGSLLDFHSKGTLVYKVIVASVMDDVTLDDGSKGVGNAAPWINLDHLDGFTPSINQVNARYVQINKEIARVESVLELSGTVGASDEYAVTLPSNFSSVDEYYKDVDLVLIDVITDSNGTSYDRVVTGESGQDKLLQRRKIVMYTGYSRLALFTKAFDPVPVAGRTRFFMRAIKVKRGEYDTGSIVIAGSGMNILVQYLGQIHSQFSQVVFLNNSWSVLMETAQWTKGTGVIQAGLFSDTIPGQTMTFSVPLINPPASQIPQNITISVNGISGVQTSTDRLIWDEAAGAEWPIVFPLLICHAGTWMKRGDVTCTDCVVGKYSEACGGLSPTQSLEEACTSCPPATYTSNVRQTTCKSCDVGYYCIGASDRAPCPPGQFSEAKSSTCQNCTLGNYCPGAQYRVNCNPGEFMNVTGATACYKCGAGSYAAIYEAWNCTLCSEGQISQSSASICTDCAAGTYAEGRGKTVCNFCGENLYQPLTGTTFCNTCPLNSGARTVMGVCTGACKGATAKSDCLCRQGFTRFGQTSDECVGFRFTLTKMAQSTACPAKDNILTVTISANAQLTTEVQFINILKSGAGYVDATLSVIEPGGSGFQGRALVSPSDGSIASILIDEGGDQYTGVPESVSIYFSPGCADDDLLCPTTLQENTIAEIKIVQAGMGYSGGEETGAIIISGGGGTGAGAYFVTDASGVITAIRFRDVSAHGTGYASPTITLDVIYGKPTRCDANGNTGSVNARCSQLNTITEVSSQGITDGCDTTVRLTTSGGGGTGFYATVTDVSPMGAIRVFYIVNHGTNYTSDPHWQVNKAECTCDAKPGNQVGAFDSCVKFLRARGAVLTAQPALNASLQAITGSRVIVNGLESGKMVFPYDAVPIYAVGAPSITAGESQACGILTNGSALCWGKSEKFFSATDIQTWTCSYKARYYRFTPLVTRNGGQAVQLAELEFYAKDASQKLEVKSASNPGGLNPPGLVPGLAADGDPETKWANLRKTALQFDLGEAVFVDRYRWMTSSDDAGLDPLQWRIEAANDPRSGSHWITIHEISNAWHGPYSVGTERTSRGVVFFSRNTFTRFWTGSCNLPTDQKFRAISVQAFHSCGINSAGVGFCWGHNTKRQIMFPDAPCDCSDKYNTYCSCSSANYFSSIYRKVRIDARPGQCNADGRCFNTYFVDTCTSKQCQYIYTTAECHEAGKSLGIIPQSATNQSDRPMVPGNSPSSPKGCYLISNAQVASRVRFNANNLSSTCTLDLNCICKDCPSFSFIPYSDNAYCGGTFDTPEKAQANELVGAKTVDECKEACGKDEKCDFFTFYPETASVGCAPCCFKKDAQCELVDPNFVIPAAGEVKPSSTWSHLAVGYLHTCGITKLGKLNCWGFNRDGQASPPEVLASSIWKFVAPGKFHSCGLLEDLTAHCWGANDPKINSGQVLPVPGLGSYKWRMLSAGVWHTCGITQEGTLYCWGCGGKDRLGRPIGISPTGEDVNKGQCDVPKTEGIIWDMVSASEFHTCGVTSTGVAICWGCKCNPGLCPSWNSSDVNFGQCNVPTGFQWSQIAAGRYHTCGLTVTGQLRCWGCLLDAKKPYYGKVGGIQKQNASAARALDFGQCNQPKGVQTWMNAAAFKAKGQWTNRGLELSVRSNTISGADYFFGFPIQNPTQIQPHADTAVFSEGLALPITKFVHATPAVFGGLAVTGCKEGTYAGPDGQCIQCKPGRYALDCGVGSCTPCSPGQYSYFGATVCTVCGTGRFSTSYGSTSCSGCASGTYGAVTGGVSQYDGCLECEPGKYSEDYHVFDDFINNWQDVGSTSCLTCPQGHYCPGGVDKVKCAPETFNGEVGINSSEACLTCPHGLRCNGLWPRFSCISGTGFANGTVFSEKESCERECFSFERVRGQCIVSEGQNNGCTDGYDDVMCGRCRQGYYPDFLSFECIECPNVRYQALLLVIWSGVVLAIPFLVDVCFLDIRISGYLRIFLLFFQNQDLALSVNVRWPPLLLRCVRALRIMNWDLMFTNPQCTYSNPDEMWQLLFMVEASFPFITLLLLTFLASSSTFLSSFSHRKTENISRALYRLIGFYILWYSVPFVGTFLRAVECSCVPFGYELHRPSWDNCSFGGHFNTPGRTVLTNNPYIVCHGLSHWMQYIGSFAVLMFVFVGVPILLFCLPDFELSLRNPFPAEKRTISAMGRLKVVNIGIEKNEKSGIGQSPGTGVIEFLTKNILEMELLNDMCEDEVIKLTSLVEDARSKGSKKEMKKWQEKIDDVIEQQDVIFERIHLLRRSQEMIKNAMIHRGDARLMHELQIKSIDDLEVCFKAGLLNFVETIPHQKRRWKSMKRKISKVKKARGESSWSTSPVPMLWKSLRLRLQKRCKSLDIFRIRAIQAAFAFSTVLAIAPGIILTICFFVLKWMLWIMPVRLSRHKKMYFMWAHYGIKSDITGEIRRVDPLYCENDVIDNKEDIHGCIALLWRGQGEQHESTMYKVRRVQAAGAIAALVINENNRFFIPKVVAENLATFQSIQIPVMGLRASEANYLAEGSIASVIFLRDPPRLFGLRRLKALMNLKTFRPLIEFYWPDKQWFEAVVWCRRYLLVLMKYLLTRTPQLQACSVLAVNFFYCCYTLWRPFELDDLNRMELLSALSCLISSCCVVTAAVLYGSATDGIPGLELNGSAGEFEDAGRYWVFSGLANALLAILIFVGLFLLQPITTFFIGRLIGYINRCLRPPVPSKPKPPPDDNSLPPEIDEVCFNVLHAIQEFSRVLPRHSHCRSAIDVAYGVLKEQEDVILRRTFNKERRLREKPWKFVVGKGSAGFHYGKEIYVFRHHFGGMVVEIPSNSMGDVRLRNCRTGEILSCALDGILWKRDSFFAPALVQYLEEYVQKLEKQERPVMIAEAGLESHRDAQHVPRHVPAERHSKYSERDSRTQPGPEPIDALYCNAAFGRWKTFCHNPDLVVVHQQKGLEVWLTRTSAVIFCGDGRAVVVREGSTEPVTVTSYVARELLHISSVSIPGAAAIRAIEFAHKVGKHRRHLPQWHNVDTTEPVSAIAAIHNVLDALPEEIFNFTRDPRSIDLLDLAPSVSSGSDDTVVSPEKVEIDVAARRNSAYLHWKRPGVSLLRKEARLGDEVEKEDTVPQPIPEEELKRLIAAIERAGKVLDEAAKYNGDKYPDDFSKHEDVRILVTRAPKGEETVLEELLNLMRYSESAGVRALAVKAVESIVNPNAPNNDSIVLTLQELLFDPDEIVQKAADAALRVFDLVL